MCEHLFDTAKTSSPTAARSTFCPSTSTTIRPPSEFFTSSTVTPVDRTAATRKEGRRVVMVVMVVFGVNDRRQAVERERLHLRGQDFVLGRRDSAKELE